MSDKIIGKRLSEANNEEGGNLQHNKLEK